MAKEYSIGLYEKAMPDNLSWKEKFLAAKESGYDFVEISIDASEAKISRVYMAKEERLELVKTMYETGMPLHTMNMSSLTKYSLGNDKPEYVARGMEILKNAIELAGELAEGGVMVYFIVAGEGDNFKVYYSAALAPMLKETTGYIAIK